jgi:predicted DsbA family dithiol-disulfide isomerase
VSKRKIKVDVVSDVVCPWCYIGKRRLEAAIRKVNNDIEVEVNYLPFELNPNIPASGTDQKQYLAAKFGGEDRYRQLTAHVASIASQEGLRFDFDRQSVMPNTLNAHRLIQFAGTLGVQASVKEAMMKAYFEDGIDLSSNENLLTVAQSAGLDRSAAEDLLRSDKDVSAIRELESLNRRRGINGVPFFIINDKYGVSGAQPSDTLAEIFKEADAEIAVGADQSCEVDKQDC